MAYLIAIDEALRRRLVNNTSLNTLIATRVYPSFLASVPTPTFPCICFSRTPSTRDHRYGKRVTCDYDVWIYSNSGFQQVEAIYELLTGILDNEFFSMSADLGKVGFRVVEYTSQDIEPDERLYFGLFRVQAIAFFK